jgi:hypothetical protein
VSSGAGASGSWLRSDSTTRRSSASMRAWAARPREVRAIGEPDKVCRMSRSSPTNLRRRIRTVGRSPLATSRSSWSRDSPGRNCPWSAHDRAASLRVRFARGGRCADRCVQATPAVQLRRRGSFPRKVVPERPFGGEQTSSTAPAMPDAMGSDGCTAGHGLRGRQGDSTR